MSTKAVSVSGILMASVYLITSLVFLCIEGSDSSGWKLWAMIGGPDLIFNLMLLCFPGCLKVYLMLAFLYQARFKFVDEELVKQVSCIGEVTLGLIWIRLLIMIYGFAALNKTPAKKEENRETFEV
jgi:hypothetical protein